jgi:hypothetical protein
MTDDQHKADLDRVSTQNNFTDLARGAAEHPHGGGFLKDAVNGVIRGVAQGTPFSEAMVSRTEFDNYDLNAMIDLVEQTDPEDLESSGRALWDARDAIKAAADELKGQFDTVPWVGESGNAFRTWGTGLVKSTDDLSTFAGGAGDQITAAAVGLASVRKAMPPRDSRTAATQPKDFPTPERVGSNSEYAAAVQVEKDRQEAINQMNRLASYYAVSREQLQVLHDKAPTFDFNTASDVGVPKPKVTAYRPGGSVAAESQETGTATASSHHASVTSHGQTSVHGVSDSPAPLKDVSGKIVHPDVPVGTNIDSVGTLPPTTTTPVTGHTPPVTGPPPAGGGQTGPFEGGLGTPIPNGTPGRGLSGAGGLRTPASAQGRTGASGLSNLGSGRSAGRGPMSQMGRATETGRSLAKGATSEAKASPMGRAVSGGTPRAGGTTPRAVGGPNTGAGRTNGVVGGRPTAATGNSAKGGSKMPRGTVIGAEETANSRPAAGRPGQRGVVGTPESVSRPGASATTSRGATGPSEAVTGKPTGRNSAARAERNGMTRGGTGLVRGPGNSGKPGDGNSAEGAPRPDYLVEDEETHLPTKPRRDVPPVVN